MSEEKPVYHVNKQDEDLKIVIIDSDKYLVTLHFPPIVRRIINKIFHFRIHLRRLSKAEKTAEKP